MGHCKISKLLNNSTVSKFVTKKWMEVNDLSSSQYSVNKNIRFKNSMLGSNLCDYSYVYLLAAAVNETDKAEGNFVFKSNAPLRSCISKISSALIDIAEDLDLVM